MSDYGKRANGTKKGLGYFGEIRSKDGKSISTEIGANEEVDGRDLHYPLINPNLSREEIDYLVNGGKPTDAIYDKALEHALMRLKQGKNPFAEEGEQIALPPYAEELMQQGFDSVRGRR
jgi:hypothetical protein